jgi:DNA polymerase
VDRVEERQTIRAALRQQLLTDRLFGVRFAPVPRSVLERRATHGAKSAPAAGSAGTVRRAAISGVSGAKAERLRILDETQVRGCRKCTLCEGRTRTVFGQGNPSARLVFVGEGPGFEEDKQGLAFVGPAGQMLTKMIVAMGLAREEVYICNVVKCRPPGNRTPTADEILACNPYLREQLEIIAPEMIVALGAPASKTLLHSTDAIGKLRGRYHEYYISGTRGVGPAVPVMPTYHPAYLLRDPSEKRKTWQDLQMVMETLGLRRAAT